MSSPELGPRKYIFSFHRHFSAYIWGGVTNIDKPVDDLNYLFELKYATGAWTRYQLKGQHPPGVHHGCCARVHDCVYFYGGFDERGYLTGSLYQLNLTTLIWQELSPPGSGSPSKKSGCSMIQHNNTLVIYGGRTDRGFRTNETHIFDIATGTWSSPQVTGDVSKDSYFAFCKVSQNKMVKYGHMNTAIHVLDLPIMHWTKVLQSGPNLGISPTATCIGYGSDHAQLLMIGYKGVCLLNVATWELKKLQDTDLIFEIPLLPEAVGEDSLLLCLQTTGDKLITTGGGRKEYHDNRI